MFIAATGQHVGKTTVCLGLLSGLQRRFQRVGFIKPVGQQHIDMVDKDARLFKQHFSLPHEDCHISPVIVPTGHTRDYLDGKVDREALLEKICAAYRAISSTSNYTLVEGTGHVGVGNILGLSNAHVAKVLQLEMVIIASGGLGSSFDELSLNIAMATELGVKIRGVILNKVLPEKREMLLNYFPKALKKYEIPLVGCIPYSPYLGTPTIQDYELLFQRELIAGREYRYHHFAHMRLVAGSLESYLAEPGQDELIIAPATREEIIEAVLNNYKNASSALLLTGRIPPSERIMRSLLEKQIPSLYVPLCSYDAMAKITSHISKTREGDKEKIANAIDLVERYIDFDSLVAPREVLSC